MDKLYGINPSIKFGQQLGGAGIGAQPKVSQQQAGPQFAQPNYAQFDGGSLNHPVCQSDVLAKNLDFLC